jgi:2-polyprenyl-3-methyl-5-hydroxy-6-metoxy-1,4-benzoquinol methylase
MPIRYDTARIEKRYLFDMVDIPHKDILEIGSGDGRLTWQYAEEARSVTAIDLSESELQQGATSHRRSVAIVVFCWQVRSICLLSVLALTM